MKDLKLNELATFFGKKYVLVLSVSPFFQVTNKILSMMTGSLAMDMFKKPENVIEDRHLQDELSWYLVENHCEHVLDDITKMANQKEKNKDLKANQVQFVIQLCENDEEFDCHLYEGDKLLTDKLNRFPCPPTAVRICSSDDGKKATSLKTICVEWVGMYTDRIGLSDSSDPKVFNRIRSDPKSSVVTFGSVRIGSDKFE